jgi:hypothetical protein
MKMVDMKIDLYSFEPAQVMVGGAVAYPAPLPLSWPGQPAPAVSPRGARRKTIRQAHLCLHLWRRQTMPSHHPAFEQMGDICTCAAVQVLSLTPLAVNSVVEIT